MESFVGNFGGFVCFCFGVVFCVVGVGIDWVCGCGCGWFVVVVVVVVVFCFCVVRFWVLVIFGGIWFWVVVVVVVMEVVGIFEINVMKLFIMIRVRILGCEVCVDVLVLLLFVLVFIEECCFLKEFEKVFFVVLLFVLVFIFVLLVDVVEGVDCELIDDVVVVLFWDIFDIIVVNEILFWGFTWIFKFWLVFSGNCGVFWVGWVGWVGWLVCGVVELVGGCYKCRYSWNEYKCMFMECNRFIIIILIFILYIIIE